MEEDVEWVQAVDKDQVGVAKDLVAWAVYLRLGLSATAFVRNAGKGCHTNAAYPASNVNARSVEP